MPAVIGFLPLELAPGHLPFERHSNLGMCRRLLIEVDYKLYYFQNRIPKHDNLMWHCSDSCGFGPQSNGQLRLVAAVCPSLASLSDQNKSRNRIVS